MLSWTVYGFVSLLDFAKLPSYIGYSNLTSTGNLWECLFLANLPILNLSKLLYSPPSKMKNSILVVFIGISFSINEVDHLKLQLYLSTGFCNTALAIDLVGLVSVAWRRESPIKRRLRNKKDVKGRVGAGKNLTKRKERNRGDGWRGREGFLRPWTTFKSLRLWALPITSGATLCKQLHLSGDSFSSSVKTGLIVPTT